MTTEPADPLEVRSLSARSLALSALLGTHPPRLSVTALVALGELFGIGPSAMRTALSRMVGAGEAETDEGRYLLKGTLLTRQGQQDRGLTSPAESDDDAWWTVLVLADRRPLAERRQFRRGMEAALMGELRPDTWLRPANTPIPSIDDGEAVVFRGRPSVGEPGDLVAILWDLPALDRRAEQLGEALAAAMAPAGEGALATSAIPDAFLTSASVIRFLRSEPRLPPSLHRADAVDDLRAGYLAAQARLHDALKALYARAEETR